MDYQIISVPTLIAIAGGFAAVLAVMLKWYMASPDEQDRLYVRTEPAITFASALWKTLLLFIRLLLIGLLVFAFVLATLTISAAYEREHGHSVVTLIGCKLGWMEGADCTGLGSEPLDTSDSDGERSYTRPSGKAKTGNDPSQDDIGNENPFKLPIAPPLPSQEPCEVPPREVLDKIIGDNPSATDSAPEAFGLNPEEEEEESSVQGPVNLLPDDLYEPMGQVLDPAPLPLIPPPSAQTNTPPTTPSPQRR